MAASGEKQGSDSEAEKCEETNVFSSQFDALRAIHDTSVAIPCPEAKPFEDISKFINHYNRLLDLGKVERPVNVNTTASRNVSRSSCATSTTTKSGQTEKSETESTKVTDTSLRQHDPPAGKVGATKPRHSRSLKSQAGTSHAQDQEKTRRNCTVFRLMEDAEGPLSLLRWCFENKKKARVCTRTFKGLRSVCIGFVVAFDKFLNLALSDVTEIYRKPPLGKTIYHQETLTVSKILEQFRLTQKGHQETPKKEKKKWNRKERKVRLEERLKAEGVFIENYHPPPPVESGTQGQGQNEMSSTSGTVVGVKTRSNDIELEAEKAKSDKNIERKEISERGRKTDEPKQTGKDLIKPTEFYRRYVHQLFVKGDNVVLISVDKNR